MYFAKNNLIVNIKGTKEYAILNPLSGNFDLMGEKEYQILQDIKNGNDKTKDAEEMREYLCDRGYVYASKEEEDRIVGQKFNEFNKEIETSDIQLLLIPTYGCNLACTYCFQHGIEGRPTMITKEIVDAFFRYAKSEFTSKGKKVFVTLFGGEPLANSKNQREIVEYVVDKCAMYDIEIAFVTNGYDLTDYIDVIKKATVREVQVTLDGSKDYHDKRRWTAAHTGTFDRIIEGVEKAIALKMPINMRSVVDFENIMDLVNLSEYLDKKGWLDLPKELFKTAIGRNYELFECYAKPQHLMSQAELWAEYAILAKKYPVLEKFHQPEFKGVKYMVDTGDMYMASFDTCPAAKTEWVFDLYGDIYGCTASCGREDFKLGTFYPEVTLNNKDIDQWKSRNVLNIPECVDCQMNVVCGGGCGVVAANKHEGRILSPDCRPVGEMLDIGVNYYIDDIKKMSEESEDGK